MSSGLMRRQCRVCAYIYARGEKPGDETSSSTLQMTVRSGFSSRRPVAYPTQVGGYVKVAPSGSAKRSLRPSALVRCQGLAAGPPDGPAHQPLDPQRAQFATSRRFLELMHCSAQQSVDRHVLAAFRCPVLV